jgi:hypothetical protein
MRHVIRTVAAIRSAVSKRRELLLESLALRHQLTVLTRSNRRFRAADRLFWLILRRVWAIAYPSGTAEGGARRRLLPPDRPLSRAEPRSDRAGPIRRTTARGGWGVDRGAGSFNVAETSSFGVRSITSAMEIPCRGQNTGEAQHVRTRPEALAAAVTDHRRVRDRCRLWRSEETGQLLHNLLHHPGHERLTPRGSLAISSTRRDVVGAHRQSESLRILAKSAQVADRKTVAFRSRRFTQVVILRILGVCGEVAERLKAAVC